MKATEVITLLYLVATPSMSFAPPAHPEAIDGNRLLEDCKLYMRFEDGDPMSDDNLFQMAIDSSYCAGMVRGVAGTMMTYDAYKDMKQIEDTSTLLLFSCFPEKERLSTMQLTRIIVKYLEAHPMDLHKPGAQLVMIAFLEAFPCK